MPSIHDLPHRSDDPTLVDVIPLDPDDTASIDLVATRMRLTLVEVLGEERATEMFDHAGLVDRVWWHLDRSDPRRRAEVFLARMHTDVVGHTMVRADVVDGEELGLFATTYVVPAARRAGVASALLRAGEAWMRERQLPVAATFTDVHNERLLAFYASLGYDCSAIDGEWATARRSLDRDRPTPHR